MNPNNCLDFEKPIAELEAMLKELRHLRDDQELNIGDEIARLEAKSKALTDSIFASLSPWQISQLARHPLRPYTLDYIEHLFTEFQELHGDRAFADDRAVIGGPARLDGRPVMVIGHQKGRDTKEKIYRNFGMPRPEGYRKALRLMKLAERFRLPILTFIDTPGAYPGIGAEERGQSEAIARNLFEMSRLRTPVICTVIGEGGSGGALAIGVGDRVLMLQYSTYSVISPEGCAAILWKSADKAPEAAEAMGLTTDRLLKLNLIDGIIPEPPGGAHRDPARMADNLRVGLREQLWQLDNLGVEDLLEQRYRRLMAYGIFKEAGPATAAQSSWQSSVVALLGKDTLLGKDPLGKDKDS
jgi:acetyl-CoA carboxylase carboxyl transferase subunit alpha